MVLMFITILFTLNSEPFTFAVMGDPQPAKGNRHYEIFTGHIEKINELNPDFTLLIGDYIVGYGEVPNKDNWDTYKKAASKIKGKYYQIPGNHDIPIADDEKTYREAFIDSFGDGTNPFYYSFDYKDYHFIMLFNIEKAIWGSIGNEQFEWLKKDLEKNRDKNIFVSMHVPIWNRDKAAGIKEERYLFWKNNIHPLFKSHKVKAVFAGHIHSFGPTEKIDGIDYFITGGGGGHLRKWYQDFGGEHHFMLVTVDGNNIKYRVVTGDKIVDPKIADVTQNHIFAERANKDVILSYDHIMSNLKDTFNIGLYNPFVDSNLTGDLSWDIDDKTFEITPKQMTIDLKPKETKKLTFDIDVLNKDFYLKPFPKLKFNLHSKGEDIVFTRDIIFQKTLKIKNKSIDFNKKIEEWISNAPLNIYDSSSNNSVASMGISYNSNFFFIGAKVKKDIISKDRQLLNDLIIVAFDKKFKKDFYDDNDVELIFGNKDGTHEFFFMTKGNKVDYNALGIKIDTKDDKNGYIDYKVMIPKKYLQSIGVIKNNSFKINFAISYKDSENHHKIVKWFPDFDDSEETMQFFSNQLRFADVKF